jgi:superfamily II DNA or RNA helicase
MFRFAYLYTHKGLEYVNGRPMSKTLNTYAGKTTLNTEFRFHIGQYKHFMEFILLNGILIEEIDIIEKPLYTPTKVPFKLKSHLQLRDYQEEAKAFVLQEDSTDFHSRLITFPMGKGKTMTYCATIADMGQRTIAIVLPKYMEKTATDLCTNLDIRPKQVMMVRGSKELKGVISAAKDTGHQADFTVISLKTFVNFIKEYERDPETCESEASYGCKPEDLCELLGAGSIVMDEVHEHLFAIFTVMIYTHVPKIIGLSATFIDQDPFIQNIQHLMFPKEIRFDKVKMDKYIKVYAISYNFQDIFSARIRTQEFGSSNYSHMAFEKSLIKNKRKTILDNYLHLIDMQVQNYYVNGHMKEDKLAIYASSIEMCQIIVDYLKMKYTQYSIAKYTQGDPYKNAIEVDIRVTTLLSLGTAIDIPNLRTVIMTMSVQSPKSNLQVLGRLRKLSDRDVKFVYLYCEAIPKQVDYHTQKLKLFEDWTESIKELRSPMLV